MPKRYLILVLLVMMTRSSIVNGVKDNKHGGKSNMSTLQFYQNSYKIVEDRLVVESYNKSMVNHTDAFVYYYNRTTRPINSSITLLMDLSPHVRMAVQMYKFMSNEYRYFPLGFEFDFCSALEENAFGSLELRKCGNVYSKCRYLKGHTYRFCNYVPDATKYPPYVPFGKYKLNVVIKSGSDVVASYNWYGEIKEVDDWWN